MKSVKFSAGRHNTRNAKGDFGSADHTDVCPGAGSPDVASRVLLPLRPASERKETFSHVEAGHVLKWRTDVQHVTANWAVVVMCFV
jgi:hypothetical protein